MTDVWKSVPKKFCEVCKCWFYDNKVSVQHHEQGNRHKSNVQKKLHELGRIGREQAKCMKERRLILAKMETDAMRSYKKDLKKQQRQHSAHRFDLMSNSYGAGKTSKTFSEELSETNFAVWFEAMSPEGRSYYWNCATGESTWEPPVEGYVSLYAQKEQTIQRQLMASESALVDNAGSSGLMAGFPSEGSGIAGKRKSVATSLPETDAAAQPTVSSSFGVGPLYYPSTGVASSYYTYDLPSAFTSLAASSLPMMFPNYLTTTVSSYVGKVESVTAAENASNNTEAIQTVSLTSAYAGGSSVSSACDSYGQNQTLEQSDAKPYGEWVPVPESQSSEKAEEQDLAVESDSENEQLEFGEKKAPIRSSGKPVQFKKRKLTVSVKPRSQPFDD